MGLLAFAENKVELAILETGLGGRLDATTAANAEIAVITRIDYDHQQYLGDTIEQIAAEKAAIIGERTSAVILGAQPKRALQILLDRCREVDIVPQAANKSYMWGLDLRSKKQTVFERDVEPPSDLSVIPGLAGRHQIENAYTAIMIAGILTNDFNLDISEEYVRLGIENARHPGRLEFIDNVLLDGAHNPGGAKALKDYLDEFVDKPIIMIFGAMADKDVSEIAEILFPSAETLILTKAQNTRALDPAAIRAFVPEGFDQNGVFVAESIDAALRKGRELAGADKLIVVTGSLYLVGEARAAVMTAVA